MTHLVFILDVVLMDVVAVSDDLKLANTRPNNLTNDVVPNLDHWVASLETEPSSIDTRE